MRIIIQLYPHVVFCIKPTAVLSILFVAEYLENPDSHRYVEANGRSSLSVTLKICRNPSFPPDQNLIRGTLLYVYFKHDCVDMSIYSSDCVIVDTFVVERAQRCGVATENLL
jgi:hypothetical protein